VIYLNEIKRMKIVLLVVIIAVVILSLFVHDQIGNNVNNEFITAMEGKAIADEIALNWSANASFRGVRKAGEMNNDGTFSSWYYNYWTFTNASWGTVLEIQVFAAGTYEMEEIGTGLLINDSVNEIKNWTIDSNEAYEIALSEPSINSFMAHNPLLDGFFLATPDTNLTTSVWHIEWFYDAGFDDPKWAEIKIDANTGEVLYVEVDD